MSEEVDDLIDQLKQLSEDCYGGEAVCAEAAATLERVERQRDEAVRGAEIIKRGIADTWLPANQRLFAQVEAMRQALEPFKGLPIDPSWPDDAGVVFVGRIDGATHELTVGNVRRAALASSTPESVNSRLLGALAPFAAAGEQFRRTRSPIDHECMAAPIGLMVGDFLEAYAAFHATAQAEESSSKPEWRPIETAPKDGTWFLAHGDGDGWENCSFVCEWTEVGGWRECPGDYAALPTRWLPLPAAPTEARGDQPEGGQ
jgi:hypothetical protein